MFSLDEGLDRDPTAFPDGETFSGAIGLPRASSPALECLQNTLRLLKMPLLMPHQEL